MPDITEALVFWIVVTTQVVGGLSVVIARLSERTWGTAVFQRTFFVCLLAIGLATMVALSCQAGIWISGAMTLSMMSVGATLDFGSSAQAASEF